MNYIDENFKFNREYEIISIFDNVINLKYNDEVYAILNQHIKKAPFSLILEKELFEKIKNKFRNNIEKKVYLEKIDAKKYNCKINKKLYVKNLTKLEIIINNLKRDDNIIERAFQEKRKKNNLLNLIGLGIGLTPSGDDYIVGYMGAYYLSNDKTPDLFNLIVKEASKKTNFISYNYIKNAKNKLFKQEILDVLYDIENENKIEQLLSFGSSSGQDILYGIYDYLKGEQLRV